MRTVVTLSILAGIGVAFVGWIVSEFIALLFNSAGTDYAVGLITYLCIVVVACTGILLAKINQLNSQDRSADLQNPDKAETDEISD